MKLGQLKAGAGAIVKLTYIVELPVEGKSIRLTVPTTIAPRYTPPTDNSLAAREIAKLAYNDGSQTKTPLHINIETIMQGKIKKISSPSHTMESQIETKPSEQGQFEAKSSLQNATTEVMDRDLVVMIESEDIEKPVVFMERHEDTLAGMVSLIPSFKLDDQATELIFLVDRSGSMGGSSIEQAINALNLFLHSMPANCYFNIWSFGSRFDALFPSGSKLYDDSSLAKAKSHVANMSANYGGTEIYSPLKAVYSQDLIKGYARQIFVLTDGDVSNSEEVISLVKGKANQTRLFALGLGASASRHLVKGVARAGNGMSIFATLTEDLRPKVMTLLKNALQPALTDVKIIWNDQRDDPKAESKPSGIRTLLGFNKPEPPKVTPGENIGVLFDGTRMLAFKLFDKKEKVEKVTVEALAPDGPLSLTIPITKDCMLEGGKFVHQMAARRFIQDIEEAAIYGVDDDGKAQILKLALKYGLASKFTSFIGVDKETRKSFREPAMSSRQMRQEIPRGFGYTMCSGGGGGGGGGGTANLNFRLPLPMMACVQQCSLSVPGGMSFGGRQKLRGGGVVQTASASSSMEYQSDSIETDCADDMMDCATGQSFSPTMTDYAPPTDAPDDLNEMINLQLANGSFQWGTAIERLLAMPEKAAKKYCPSGETLDVWITAIAIALFEDKLKREKPLWELVVDKAKRYLTKNSNMSLDDLLKEAVDIL
jgi:hypothetical protein